jgi:hypothetical protein
MKSSRDEREGLLENGQKKEQQDLHGFLRRRWRFALDSGLGLTLSQ